MIRTVMVITLIVLTALVTGVTIMPGTPDISAQDTVYAPDFPEKAEWLNTSRPLTMKELRGRVVLLDFWTYCCINCMHVLPDLARLEAKYGDRLAVVGVHSAKFSGEKDTDNIRDAVLRYGIHHPVVNDSAFRMWYQIGVDSWPTFVLIDVDGKILGKVSGEGNYDVVDRAIAMMLARGRVDTAGLDPLPVRTEADHPRRELRYPGKVEADPSGNRLFVADSGHNRILIVDPENGEILDVIGSGEADFVNGTFETAAFANPQGMALAGDRLYVADTDNHALREVDLTTRRVRTLAGTGSQGRLGNRGGTARITELNSPWDVTVQYGRVYIALAGSHQIWVYDPVDQTVQPAAGSGRENIRNGLPEIAELAQPSGIVTAGNVMYFVDSETSSVRQLDVAGKEVTTLVGTGLFDFGYHDGALSRARLQHPLGIAWDGTSIWVADTYNNVIRKIDPSRKVIATVAGNGDDGLDDGIAGAARFDEPGGIAYANGVVYVADTNNHAIRSIDPVTSEVRTIVLAPQLAVAPEQETITFRIVPPEGFHVTTEAPSTVDMVTWNNLTDGDGVAGTVSEEAFTAELPLAAGDGGQVVVTGTLYVCDDGPNAVCRMWPFSFTRTVRVSADSPPGPVTVTVSPPG